MPAQNAAVTADFTINCGGQDVDKDKIVSFNVSLDMGQPDMCCVTLRNDDNAFSNDVSLGAPLEIKTSDGTLLFAGETIGMDSDYKAGGNNTVMVRGVNCLHRMLRTHRSQTFVEMTEDAIVQRIVQNYPLTAECGQRAQEAASDHVYQTNQTDLEFLRVRAARLAYDLWVEDNKVLHFDAPDLSADSKIKLRYGDAETAARESAVFLKRFSPKLSTAGIVEQVEVRGWDPMAKKEIVATFKSSDAPSPLGGKNAFDATYGGASSGFKGMTCQSFEVDQPISCIEEAKAIAESKFRAAAMGFITGEGECRGSAEIKLGAVVDVMVNPDNSSDRFNGKYMVVGATHRYTTQGRNGGYTTEVRVRRDAEGS